MNLSALREKGLKNKLPTLTDLLLLSKRGGMEARFYAMSTIP